MKMAEVERQALPHFWPKIVKMIMKMAEVERQALPHF